MIAEAKYRGVTCARCGKPIPVSGVVITLENEIESGDGYAPYAFAVRCKRCQYECIYVISDIRAFDGEPPPKRSFKARAA